MAKLVRKPLGDLTNTHRPRAQHKKDLTNTHRPRAQHKKKNCERKAYDWVKEEGFLHNHDECIKAQRQSENMIMDHYLQSLNDVTSAHNSIFLSFSDSDSDSHVSSPEIHNMSDFEIHFTSPRKRPESPSWNIDTAWDSHLEMLCENSLAALTLAALNLR